MNSLQKDVFQWMIQAGQDPAMGHPEYELNTPLSKLYLRLVEEEYGELREAWMKDDLIGTADGIADLVWVIMGFCTAVGINFQDIWDEIKTSNMSKVSGDLKVRKDGKVVKPKHYVKPDLQKILFPS